jgi:outer membrane receptor for ferrienterochelin and colicins
MLMTIGWLIAQATSEPVYENADIPEAASSSTADALPDEPDIWAILDEQREASDKVVSATKIEQRLSDTPAAVAVVTGAELMARGYRSVAEGIRALAGVFIANDQVVPDASLRGINGGLRSQSNTLKVMIDGHSIAFRPDTNNFIGPELIPLEVIDRIELIRGPAAAVYGANAFLGVINIVTKNVTDSGFQYRLNGFATNDRQLGAAGSLVGRYKGERWSLLLGAAADYTKASGLLIEKTYERQTLAVGQTTRNDQKLPKSGFLRATLDAGDAGNFILDGSLSHLDSYAKFSEWSANSAINRLSVLNGFARLRWNRALNADKTLQLRAFVALHMGGVMPNERLDNLDPTSYYERELDHAEGSTGVEMEWQALDWLRWSLAVDYSHDSQKQLRYTRVLTQQVNDLPPGTQLSQAARAKIDFNNFGASTQLLVQPLSWLSAIAGFRFDYNSGYGEGYSPRVGVVVHPVDMLSVKLLYGRSFKPPTGVQLSSRPALNNDISGNPVLRPQTGDTIEAIATIQPVDMLKVSATGFALWVQDQIVFERFGISSQARNTSRVSSFGVEGEVRFETRRVDAFATVTLAEARAQNALDATLNVTQRVPATPIWYGSVGLLGRLPEWFVQAYAEFRFVGDRAASLENIRRNSLQPYTLAPYAVVDLCLSSLQLKLLGAETQVSLRVQNLLATRYATAGYGGIDAPNLGRVFELTWMQKF